MKSKLKKIFVFLLIIPAMFIFSACGKTKVNPSTSTDPSTEQTDPSEPTDPTDPSTPDDDDDDDDGGEVETDVYKSALEVLGYNGDAYYDYITFKGSHYFTLEIEDDVFHILFVQNEDESVSAWILESYLIYDETASRSTITEVSISRVLDNYVLYKYSFFTVNGETRQDFQGLIVADFSLFLDENVSDESKSLSSVVSMVYLYESELYTVQTLSVAESYLDIISVTSDGEDTSTEDVLTKQYSTEPSIKLTSNEDEEVSVSVMFADEYEEPQVGMYSVSIHYCLPENYAAILEDKTEQLESSETYNIESLSAEYEDYFSGWYLDANYETALDASDGVYSVSGTDDEVINVYAKWSETNMKKYFSLGGLEYEIDDETYEATISGCDSTSTIVVIPQYYTYEGNDYQVVAIADSVFANSSVVSVCTYLSSLKVGNNAFRSSALASFDMSIVSSIGNNAFAFTKLESATFSSQLSEMGTWAFSFCANLVSVDFSEVNKISKLPDYTFDGCSSLQNVKFNQHIDDAMNEIGEYAFSDCTSLSDLSFLAYNALTVIGKAAFSGCTSVSDISFLNSTNVTEILQYTFSETSITSLEFSNSSLSKISTIETSAFYSCTSLSELIISSDITISTPFTNCSNLKTIVTNNLSSTSTFSSIYGDLTSVLEDLTLTGDISALVSWCFSGYTALKSIDMSESQIATIGGNAFKGCTSLESIEFSDSLDVESLDVSIFSDTVWYKNLEDVVVIKNYVVRNASSGEVSIDEGVVGICSHAFESNTEITKISLPSTLKTIGNYSFNGCTALEEVVFATGSALEEIGRWAFCNCSALDTFDLSNCESLTTIGTQAFMNCSSLTGTFLVPASVSSIGSGVFASTSITAFSVASENTSYTAIDGILFNSNVTTLLAYPVSTSSKIYYLPTTVTQISAYAFSGSTNLYVYVQNEDGNTLTIKNNAASSTTYFLIYSGSIENEDGNCVVCSYLDCTYGGNVESENEDVSCAVSGNSANGFSFEFNSSVEVGYYFVSFEYESETYYYILYVSSIYTANDISSLFASSN